MSQPLALIMCPYFTNGDYPPLGLACINGALQAAGHETACFDFQYLLYRDHFELFHILRQLFNLGRVGDEVVYVLRPDLIVYYLFKDRYPDFSWSVGGDTQERTAAAMFMLGLKPLMKKWAEMVLLGKPRAVLFSTYLSNLFMSLRLAAEIKVHDADLPIILGGPGSSLPEVRDFILSLGIVDGVVAGEGEFTAQQFAEDPQTALRNGIPGLAVKRKDEIIFSPREQARNLDELPRASFAGFPLPGQSLAAYQANRPNRFLTPFFEGLSLYTTRGCVNRCSYCTETAYWRGFRQRSVEKVAEEIQFLCREYQTSRFLFGDSALNARSDWLYAFCDKTAGLDPKPCFSSYLLGDRLIDADLSRAMARGGFKFVTLGVETFSEGIRGMMNKRGSAEEVFQSICNLVSAGINVKANLLVGFPRETEEDVAASIGMVERWAAASGPTLRRKVYFDAGHPLRLEPYSRLYERPEEFGIEIKPYQLMLPSPLGSVSAAISKILLRWSCGLSPEAVNSRSERLKQAVQKIYLD